MISAHFEHNVACNDCFINADEWSWRVMKKDAATSAAPARTSTPLLLTLQPFSHPLRSIGGGRSRREKFLVKNVIASCPVRVFVMKKVRDEALVANQPRLRGRIAADDWKKFAKLDYKVKRNECLLRMLA